MPRPGIEPATFVNETTESFTAGSPEDFLNLLFNHDIVVISRRLNNIEGNRLREV